MDTCCVADQFCIAPANLDPPASARGECYYCGSSVCSQCSSKRKYDKSIRRLCNECQRDMDGERSGIQHESYWVTKRLYIKAGYSFSKEQWESYLKENNLSAKN